MELESLKLFVDVAQRGSFSAVARARGVDPSSVSRAVAAIEAALSVRLFQRSTRAMVLTEAGRRYLSRAAPVLEELERAGEEATSTRSDPIGTLRLTASVAFTERCLSPLLTLFRETFPRLKLELIATDAPLDLVTEAIDLAIRLAPSYRADVIGVKLFSTRYRVVASPAYVAREGHLSSPAELSRRSCLRFALPDFRTRWLFRKRGVITEVPVSGDLIISSALSLRSAALAGLGPCMLADWLLHEDLATRRLVDLLPDYEVTATTFDTGAWLLYPSREYLPSKVRSTIDFLKEHLGAPKSKRRSPLR